MWPALAPLHEFMAAFRAIRIDLVESVLGRLHGIPGLRLEDIEPFALVSVEPHKATIIIEKRVTHLRLLAFRASFRFEWLGSGRFDDILRHGQYPGRRFLRFSFRGRIEVTCFRYNQFQNPSSSIFN